MSARSSSPLPAALRGSGTWPAAPDEARAKTLPLSLRAGEVPRSLRLKSPLRANARDNGAKDFAEAVKAAGVSDGDLAASFGLESDREGAELTSGKAVVTFGEVISLAPIPVVLRLIARGLERRIANDNALGFPVDDARLVGACLDTLRSLLK